MEPTYSKPLKFMMSRALELISGLKFRVATRPLSFIWQEFSMMITKFLVEKFRLLTDYQFSVPISTTCRATEKLRQ